MKAVQVKVEGLEAGWGCSGVKDIFQAEVSKHRELLAAPRSVLSC